MFQYSRIYLHKIFGISLTTLISILELIIVYQHQAYLNQWITVPGHAVCSNNTSTYMLVSLLVICNTLL